MALGFFYEPTNEDRQRLFDALKAEGMVVTYLDIQADQERLYLYNYDGLPIKQKLVARYVCSRSNTQVKSKTLRALRKAKLRMADWVYQTDTCEFVLTVKGET